MLSDSHHPSLSYVLRRVDGLKMLADLETFAIAQFQASTLSFHGLQDSFLLYLLYLLWLPLLIATLFFYSSVFFKFLKDILNLNHAENSQKWYLFFGRKP